MLYEIDIYDNKPCLKFRYYDKNLRLDIITGDFFDIFKLYNNPTPFHYSITDDGLYTTHDKYATCCPLVELLYLDNVTIDMITILSNQITNLKNETQLVRNKQPALDKMAKLYPSILLTANIEHEGINIWFNDLSEQEIDALYSFTPKTHSIRQTEKWKNLEFERMMKE